MSQQESLIRSKRMQKKRYHELINQIAAKLDGKILGPNYPELDYIDRPNKHLIYLKVHGNKYVVWVEVMSQDQQAIEQIKQSFPEVF